MSETPGLDARDDGDARVAPSTVPVPDFAGDDGSADPGLAAVLAARARGEASERDLVQALTGRRLMVPLVAVLDEAEPGAAGPAQEKDSHLASVSLIGLDGRPALLAFSSVAALAAWDPAARGVPAVADAVARSAIDDGAAAVLLDLAGPARVTVSGRGLEVLAGGLPWPVPHDDPEVQDAVAQLLGRLRGLASYEVLPGGGDADLLVLVEADDDIDVATLAGIVAEALAEDEVVSTRCLNGFEVGVLDEAATIDDDI